MTTLGLRWASYLTGLLLLTGCGASSEENKEKVQGKNQGGEKALVPGTNHSHGDWWCNEHGIPEEECGLCHDKIRNRLKADEKCPKHPDRKPNQCFICNPDKWPASAARYTARYPGQEPPQPNEENWPKK